MQNLIDLFSPQELLHLVGVANKFKILSTDDKRYIIALRMAAVFHEDSGWEVEPERKDPFNKVLNQFFSQLPDGGRCDKDECLICDRFEQLRLDFAGPQESLECSLFMAWVSNSTQEYETQKEDFQNREALKRLRNQVVDEGQKLQKIRNQVEAFKSYEVDQEDLADPTTMARVTRSLQTSMPSCPDMDSQESFPTKPKRIRIKRRNPASRIPDAQLAEGSIHTVKSAVEGVPETKGAKSLQFPIQRPSAAELVRDTAEPLFVLNAEHPLVSALQYMAAVDLEVLNQQGIEGYSKEARGLFQTVLDVFDEIHTSKQDQASNQ